MARSKPYEIDRPVGEVQVQFEVGMGNARRVSTGAMQRRPNTTGIVTRNLPLALLRPGSSMAFAVFNSSIAR
jgi:hypothetical protein